MKRFMSLTVVLILTVIVFAAFPNHALAASGNGYNISIDKTSLPHGGSGTISLAVSIPTGVTAGSVFLDIRGSSGIMILGTVGLRTYADNPVSRNGTSTYTVLNNATENQLIYWSVTSVLNGVNNDASGQILITVQHDYSLTAIVPPTCTEQGYTTHTCSVCGVSYKDTYTDALGHAWSFWAHDAATTGANAGHIRTCSNDPAHTESQFCIFNTSTIQPTCTEQGHATHTCSICGYGYTDDIPALGHAWSPWVHDATTNGANSTHIRTCGNNPAHTESQFCTFNTSTVQPTCTEQGHATHSCSLCGYSYNDTFTDTLGHAWSFWVHDAATTGANAGHIRTCGNDPGHTESQFCTFNTSTVQPTCTEQGHITHTCSVCGYSYIDTYTPALGHVWSPWVHDAATNGANATHIRTCANDTSHTESQPCAFNASTVQPTCTEPGHTTHTCSACGYGYTDDIPALGHVPGEWVTTLEPTNKKAGERTKSCTRCNALLITEKIPVLSEIWSDNTACSMGIRFRDAFPGLTHQWYMYTPVDLTQEGTVDIPLLASGVYMIGTVHVTVADGAVSAVYEVTADKVEVKEEFMTLLTALENLESVEPESMADQSLPFGAPVSISDRLGGAKTAYLFLRLVITYDIYADGVTRWYSTQ